MAYLRLVVYIIPLEWNKEETVEKHYISDSWSDRPIICDQELGVRQLNSGSYVISRRRAGVYSRIKGVETLEEPFTTEGQEWHRFGTIL